ncbi:MAG: SDR family oxidoreductase, partial [Cyanobacteria bacterium P01_A01_bin.80]
QEQVVLTSVRHPKEEKSDVACLLTTVGNLWLAGVNVDWLAFYSQEERYRVPLPTYPFEGQRYWISPPKAGEKVKSKKQEISKQSDISQWFYVPSWKRVPLAPSQLEESPGYILLFADEHGLGEHLATQLTQIGEKVTCVRVGDSFTKQGEDIYTVNPQQADDYNALINELVKLDMIPKQVIHLWSLTNGNLEESLDYQVFNKAQDVGFYSLLFIAQALGKQALVDTCDISVISNQLFYVTGDDNLSPEKATLLGPIRTISQEYFNFSCRCIDVVIPQSESRKEKVFIDNLISELTTATNEQIVAYRGKSRWVEIFEPFKLQPQVESGKQKLKQQGVYLITGGLGNIGLVLAEYLANNFSAKLILVGRSNFPERDSWSEWIDNHDEQDKISQKINKLQQLEASGAEILIESADVSSLQEMQSIIEKAENKFGAINGVIHAAAAIEANPIEKTSQAECKQQFLPKVNGVLVLEKLFVNKNLDFCLLMSSLSSILGGLGFVTYGASNAFLDYFVNSRSQKENNFPWITVNWDGWKVGREETQNEGLDKNLGKL